MSNSIGDLKNSGLQGNNFPWQLKMLEGLQKIYDEVKKPLTCAEDSVNLCTPGGGIPVVIDCNDRISLCVNGAVVNAANSLPVTVVNPLPLEVNINQANDSILIYGFDGVANQPISVTPTGEVNIRPLTCTDTVSLCFDNAGTPTQVSDTNPLPVNAIVTVPNLDCSTDSVAICDGAGNALLIDSNGSINSNLYAQDASTGLPQPVTLTGLGTANALDVNITNTGLDIRPLTCTDEVSLCNNGATVDSSNPLPVDAGALTPSADGVGMYGSTDGGTNWTAVQVDSFGVVSTNSTIVGPIGNQDCDNSVAVSLCTDQAQDLADIKTAVASPFAMNLDSINVPNGVTGDLDLPISIKSITFYSTGTAPVTLSVNGGTTTFPLAPGTSLNLDPGNPVAYYDGVTFQYNTTTAGATLLIIYNYI